MTQISVTAPVGLAIDTVKHVLFQTFNITKWFGMGFTAWLAAFSNNFQPGFNFGNNPVNQVSDLGDNAEQWLSESVLPWVQSHLGVIVSIGILLTIIILAVSLVILWINSRGQFMFLDNVVNNRGEIKEPWKRLKMQGNSYFLFSICFHLAVLAIVACIGFVLFAVALPDITRHNFGFNAISAIILGVTLFTVFGLTTACALVFLHDFVVPIMVSRSCRIMVAWSLFLDLLKANTGCFVLYLLFRMVLFLAVGIITIVLCCALCCIVMIPYLGTVLLLPLFVFKRSYSVHYLEQFGESYRLFTRDQSLAI